MFHSCTLKLKPLIISLIIPLGVGSLAGLLTRANVDIYEALTLPPLSPPPFIFPVAWTLLYVLMGISAYLIYMSKSYLSGTALTVYSIQLAANFIWPIVFFNLQLFLPSFILLIVLWLLILLMILIFSKINKTAAILQIPYILWVTFAGYLNLGIWLLNK